MSTNNHGLPSRVPVIAEMGRLFADPQVPGTDKREALEVLLQDHGDLDDVEAQAALWAINQLSDPALAREAWLGCATACCYMTICAPTCWTATNNTLAAARHRPTPAGY